MTNSPMVSVIIPVHNQEKFIGRCLRSVLNQTFPRDGYEVIVIDDHSTDATSEVLHQFREDIRLIQNSKQSGLPASLNRGIRAAKGRFLVRVDADDYVHAEYLNILSLHLSLNDEIDAIACDYFLVNDREEVMEKKNCLESPIGCGIMFRTEQLIDLGMYDEEFLMNEDQDLRIRFVEQYVIHRVELPLYRYRRHESNMTNDSETLAKYQSDLKKKVQRKKRN